MHIFSNSIFSGANLVALINFLLSLGFSSVGMLEPLLALYLGLTQTEIGTLLFVSSVSSSLVRIPAGIASDRYGRRLSVLASGITLAASTALFLISGDFVQMLLPFSLSGIGAGIYYTTSNALIADVTEVTARVKGFARVQMMGLVASLVSPLATGFLADSFGLFLTFLFPAASFLMMCLLSLKLPVKRVEAREVRETRGGLNSLRDDRLKGVVITFAVLNAVHGFYAGIFWPALTIIYKSQFHLDYSEIGLLNSASMITQMLGLSLSNRITARFKPKWFMAVATVGSALVALGYSIIDSTMWLLPLSLISGLTATFGFQSPIGSAILMNNISPHVRGTVQGMIGTVWRAGMASGNLAMGNVWALYGITAIPLLGSVFLVIESLLVLTRLPEK